MPDPVGPPEPPYSEKEDGLSLLAAISKELVRAKKEHFGKGPERARSYMVDDLLFVVMRGGMLPAEKTLVDAGDEEAARAFRQRFQDNMDKLLPGIVEQLSGRKVINYQSQTLYDPDIVVEIFVFEDRARGDARQATAEAVIDPDEAPGEVKGSEVE
ncbi:MAG TPA: Na-translocating system protein MpsC family protein [Solirubrobacterales bacterium]|nr:Na-translocating system protein MpsC family protein [Solirubrobacterales bacterium]